jgi:hypothetical protein
MHAKKSQTSIEFIMITVAVLLVFLILIGLIFEKERDMDRYEIYLNAKKINDYVAMSVDQVYIAGDGSVKEIYIPPALIQNTDYTMQFVENLMEIKWEDKHYTTPMITSNITGTLKKGYNNISNQNKVINIG